MGRVNWVIIVCWVAAALITVAVFVTLVRGGRPIRTAFLSGAQGIGALLAVDVAGIFTGVSVGLNALTLLCGAILGVPGVIGLLVLKTVFQIG